MKTDLICNYAVVRFLPYPETDEFVNVGVVLGCPQTGAFEFKLESRRRDRITHFFPELDTAIFLEGRRTFLREMERLKGMMNPHGSPNQLRLDLHRPEFGRIFSEIVKPRESIFRFGPVGTRATADPAKEVDELFRYYVERQFAAHVDYQETIMTRRLSVMFRAENILERYHEKRFGDDLYHVTMPFVHEGEDRACRAIKPLDLDKQDSTRIIEYGDKWRSRIERLRKMNNFPDVMLFVLRQPKEGRLLDAAGEVRHVLINLGTLTAPESNKDEILDFARAG